MTVIKTSWGPGGAEFGKFEWPCSSPCKLPLPLTLGAIPRSKNNTEETSPSCFCPSERFQEQGGWLAHVLSCGAMQNVSHQLPSLYQLERRWANMITCADTSTILVGGAARGGGGVWCGHSVASNVLPPAHAAPIWALQKAWACANNFAGTDPSCPIGLPVAYHGTTGRSASAQIKIVLWISPFISRRRVVHCKFLIGFTLAKGRNFPYTFPEATFLWIAAVGDQQQGKHIDLCLVGFPDIFA